MKNFTTILLLSLIIFSCTTLPEGSTIHTAPPETAESENPADLAAAEYFSFSDRFLESFTAGSRNIDSRDWLMAQINFWSDRDILSVQRIYEDMKYRNLSDREKREYLSLVLPRLAEYRNSVAEELGYLIGSSLVLQDMPWFVRDFFDERSEFSYWYLAYTSRTIDPEWQQNTILPAMLRLIPEDRVTAVSYLWLRNPASLAGMESEIYLAGYPWSRLIYLLTIGDYLNRELERLDLEEPLFSGGSLF